MTSTHHTLNNSHVNSVNTINQRHISHATTSYSSRASARLPRSNPQQQPPQEPFHATGKPAQLRQQQIPFSANQHSDIPWGDDPGNKSEKVIRFYFQNVNGLPSYNPNHDIPQKLAPLYDIEPNYIGIAEANLEFNNPTITYNTKLAFQRLFDRSTTISPSTSDIPFPKAYKPGGTLTAAVGAWASRTIYTGQDKHGLGRWSYIILRAKNERCVALLTAYRVCQTNSSGASTAFTQQRTLLRTAEVGENVIVGTAPALDPMNPKPKQAWDHHFREQIHHSPDERRQVHA